MQVSVITSCPVVVNVVSVPDDWTGAPGEWQPPAGSTTSTDATLRKGSYLFEGVWQPTIVPPSDPVPDPVPAGRISKRTIIERLIAANEANAFIDALKEAPVAEFNWQANSSFAPDDALLIAVLIAAGSEPARILAPE